MFCKSISRVARSTTSLPVSSASAARANAGSSQATSCKASTALHQRRYSSSKPSCPPGGSGKSESDAATENPARRPTNSTRLPRRKAKEAAEEIALKARDAAFARLPAVPPTSHMSELDVKMASVFSMHRPISVTTPWPQHTTTASFNSIFNTRSSTDKVSDVIYTLSSTVSAMEGATGQHAQEEKDLRWELLQESSSHNAASPLDGTRGPPLSLDKIISQYRPFNVPPAPVPFSEKQEATATESQQQQQAVPEPQAKTFTTTLTISESISSTGRKTYTASASPIVEQDAKSRPRARLIVREREAARMQAKAARTEVGVPETILEEEEETDGRSMQLISVKRQRKLKMKKHKYKKLMRRTRNLRRRIGRA